MQTEKNDCWCSCRLALLIAVLIQIICANYHHLNSHFGESPELGAPTSAADAIAV